MLLKRHVPQDIDLLCLWLNHLDTLIGSNLPYDIMALRTIPRIRAILDSRRHTLIDSTICSYLHSEVRDSHSLKAIGPATGTYRYEEEPDEGESYKRYHDANDPDLHHYNCEDSWTGILAVSEMARRILRDYPHTHKLSPFCIQYYSDTIWTCIRMSEAGVPMNATRLHRLEYHLLHRIARAERRAAQHGLQLSGEGSDLSKAQFLTSLIQEIDSCAAPLPSSNASLSSSSRESYSPSSSHTPAPQPSVLDHPLLVKTPKKKQVSFNNENRALLASLLPPSSPLRIPLELADKHSQLSKLASTYTFPLLHHGRKDKPPKLNKTSQLIPSFNLWLPLHFQRVDPPLPIPQVSSPAPESPSPSSDGPSSSEDQPSSSSSASSLPASSPPLRNVSTTTSAADWRGDSIRFSHPTWFITPTAQKDDSGSTGGTIQLRITCKKHSHQTDPPLIQSCIASRFRDAGLIAKCDASQIELRVPGILSGEPTIIAEYNKPDPDLHTAMAIEVFSEEFLLQKYGPTWKHNVVFRKHTQGERQVAKHVNFGNVYRATASTMHSTVLEMTGLNLSLAIFERIEHRRPEFWPVLWNWQEHLLEKAERNGYLEVPLVGASRRFTGFKRRTFNRDAKNMANEIVNMPIQSTAGAVMLNFQHYLHRLLPSINNDNSPCHMFLNIYDAAFFDCRLSYLPTLKRAIADATHLCSTVGLWGQLQRMTGNTVPLVFELTL